MPIWQTRQQCVKASHSFSQMGLVRWYIYWEKWTKKQLCNCYYRKLNPNEEDPLTKQNHTVNVCGLGQTGHMTLIYVLQRSPLGSGVWDQSAERRCVLLDSLFCDQLLATSSALSAVSKVLSSPPRTRQIFTVRSLEKQHQTKIRVNPLLSRWPG